MKVPYAESSLIFVEMSKISSTMGTTTISHIGHYIQIFWKEEKYYAKNIAISKKSKVTFVIDNFKAIVFADQRDNTLCHRPLTHSMPLTATTY